MSTAPLVGHTAARFIALHNQLTAVSVTSLSTITSQQFSAYSHKSADTV